MGLNVTVQWQYVIYDVYRYDLFGVWSNIKGISKLTWIFIYSSIIRYHLTESWSTWWKGIPWNNLLSHCFHVITANIEQVRLPTPHDCMTIDEKINTCINIAWKHPYLCNRYLVQL